MAGGTAPGGTLFIGPAGALLECLHRANCTQAAATGSSAAPAEASSVLSSACSYDAQAPLALVLPRVPAPQLSLTDTLGRSICLPALLRGKVTAVQLMFAGCSSTCPIQGAVFAAVTQKVKATRRAIAELDRRPSWRHPAVAAHLAGSLWSPRLWTAGLPRVQDVDALSHRDAADAPDSSAPAPLTSDGFVALGDLQAEAPAAHAPLPLPFPVVSIGASAGGVEVVRQLFKAMPVDTGCAFVVVMHLAAERPSMLDTLIARCTTMPVQQVNAETVVAPNHVYIASPGNYSAASDLPNRATAIATVPRSRRH